MRWQALAVRYADQCILNEMTFTLQFYEYSKKPNQSISYSLSAIKRVIK